MPLVSTLRKVGALLSKELLVEYRTKAGLMSFIQFSFISLFLVSMSMNAVSSSMGLETLSALFWIIIFFTTLATLDKAFVQERERGTLLALQLYTPAQVVFLGKFLYNFCMVLVMSLLLGIGFIILMDVDVTNIGYIVLLLVLGDLGIAAAGTLLGALVAFMGNQHYLFAIISFPIFLPIFLLLIQAMTEVLGSTIPTMTSYLMILAYNLLVLAVSSILFDFLWYE